MRRPRQIPSVARRMGGLGETGSAQEGGLFERLRELADGMRRLAEQGSAAGSGGEGRVVFGYSIRFGDGEVRGEAFGHVPAAGEPAPRQPIVDVFEAAEEVRVVAEMPGVAAEQVEVRLHGTVLHLATSAGPRWEKEIALPVPVTMTGMSVAARNGIVEVRLRRTETDQ